MRSTQRTALPLFVDRGFDDVAVSEIAEETGIAASTIYRHFSTKEAIVLWDEHEQVTETVLVRELKRHPPLEAMRLAFIEAYGDRYADDLEFQLARITYIYETEALHAAAVEADFADREDLADGLKHFLKKPNKHLAPLLAGAALLALDHAFDEWQRNRAKRPLAQLIDEAFSALAELGSIR